MPLCSAAATRTGGHTLPLPSAGCDKVAAIRPRGSALQLASCRLGDDCQGPSGGRINSSCSALRCAHPVGALAAARGQTTPPVSSGAGVWGSWVGGVGWGGEWGGAGREGQFRAEPPSREEDQTVWQLRSPCHADSRPKRRLTEEPGDDGRQMSQTCDAFVWLFFFFYLFFSYDSRFIQVTAIQRSPRSPVDRNVLAVLVRLEMGFLLSGVQV